MTDTLIQAYFPLILWTGLGLLMLNWVPDRLPRWLGRSLYWVGVPLQIFTLARQTDLSAALGVASVIVAIALLSSLLLSWLALQAARAWVGMSLLRDMKATSEMGESLVESLGIAPSSPLETAQRRGSFLIAAILGNTGFVGLAIAPSFIPQPYQGWLVMYSVAQNVIGTYGLGVFLSSYYGRSLDASRTPALPRWWVPLRDVLMVPSLWSFAAGYLGRSIVLPDSIEAGLHASLGLIIPAALLLMGMRLRQIQGWKSLKLALLPTLIKTLVLPLWVGLFTVLWDLPPAARLAMVLMAGMPTAFAGLILAEEYELDRDLIASSIVVTTALLLLSIPLWLLLFGSWTQEPVLLLLKSRIVCSGFSIA